MMVPSGTAGLVNPYGLDMKYEQMVGDSRLFDQTVRLAELRKMLYDDADGGERLMDLIMRRQRLRVMGAVTDSNNVKSVDIRGVTDTGGIVRSALVRLNPDGTTLSFLTGGADVVRKVSPFRKVNGLIDYVLNALSPNTPVRLDDWLANGTSTPLAVPDLSRSSAGACMKLLREFAVTAIGALRKVGTKSSVPMRERIRRAIFLPNGSPCPSGLVKCDVAALAADGLACPSTDDDDQDWIVASDGNFCLMSMGKTAFKRMDIPSRVDLAARQNADMVTSYPWLTPIFQAAQLASVQSPKTLMDQISFLEFTERDESLAIVCFDRCLQWLATEGGVSDGKTYNDASAALISTVDPDTRRGAGAQEARATRDAAVRDGTMAGGLQDIDPGEGDDTVRQRIVNGDSMLVDATQDWVASFYQNFGELDANGLVPVKLQDAARSARQHCQNTMTQAVFTFYTTNQPELMRMVWIAAAYHIPFQFVYLLKAMRHQYTTDFVGKINTAILNRDGVDPVVINVMTPQAAIQRARNRAESHTNTVTLFDITKIPRTELYNPAGTAAGNAGVQDAVQKYLDDHLPSYFNRNLHPPGTTASPYLKVQNLAELDAFMIGISVPEGLRDVQRLPDTAALGREQFGSYPRRLLVLPGGAPAIAPVPAVMREPAVGFTPAGMSRRSDTGVDGAITAAVRGDASADHEVVHGGNTFSGRLAQRLAADPTNMALRRLHQANQNAGPDAAAPVDIAARLQGGAQRVPARTAGLARQFAG